MDYNSHKQRYISSKNVTSHKSEEKKCNTSIDLGLKDKGISHVLEIFPNLNITQMQNSNQEAWDDIIYNQQFLNNIESIKVRKRRVSFSIIPNKEKVMSPSKNKAQIKAPNLDYIKEQKPKNTIKVQFSVNSQINTENNIPLNTKDNINEPTPIISSLKSDNKAPRTNQNQKLKSSKRPSVYFLASKQYQLENIKANVKTTKGKNNVSTYKSLKKPQSKMSVLDRDWKYTYTNQSISIDIPRNELTHQFLINNPLRNKTLYKHQNNFVSTMKYNLVTWIPKSLWVQFSRLANVYFLFFAIIQSIPLISPLTPVTAIIPLVFVLLVSMIREWIEDFQRYKYDRWSNEEIVIVYRNKQFVWACSSSLEVGDIILWKEGSLIPCDIILIDSSLNEGICYIETSSWDGEKALKEKISNKATFGIFSNKIIDQNIAFKEMKKRLISNNMFDAQSSQSVEHQNSKKSKTL